ncbi:TylF/MycF/NovP-related O-methyltransferase [Mariniflexile litorale]|uniref:TylF/MycF/NovP-related O-methyltransferase n=1 Tax=Mariniflexile litorale TaxID=3045158 RepID=A0AAU7E9H0_9FLAO|nr:TylF/MycF/NovP-related O-methyltransferase [Mariniflexile sp. KMM 9835]MDQ8213428.1 TylF/MycF/NovP-related O-methyltransferase [Mariniflexile sp. KMM 9835]
MPFHPFLSKTKLYKLLKKLCKPFYIVYEYAEFVAFMAENKDKGEINDYYNNSATYKNRYKLHDKLLLELKNKTIFYYEFGVAEGAMIKNWSSINKIKESRFVGFDSFEGLPESWEDKKEGHFDQKGNFPDIDDDRVRFVKGWFQDSVYNTLLDCHFHEQCVFHLDADLFSSTLYVLFQISPKLKAKDILIFDEFSSHDHEFKAFEIFKQCTNDKWKFEFLGAVNNYRQVAFILK